MVAARYRSTTERARPVGGTVARAIGYEARTSEAYEYLHDAEEKKCVDTSFVLSLAISPFSYGAERARTLRGV